MAELEVGHVESLPLRREVTNVNATDVMLDIRPAAKNGAAQ